ncbi:MAG: adenosine deaminase [Promicromonosporaceae bacterium]|nr:adenosine deaminase [Promicromonosporaceae bacterium]
MSDARTLNVIPELPKVLLHDHLDGGLRPQTVLELAAAVGHPLPADDADALADWFQQAADSGSLERYLETFAHTLAVMQTPEALTRVAREAVIDLAADGVVYVEQRWAPEQHLTRGLSLAETVEAVQAGIEEGIAAAAEAGYIIRVGQILSAMRQADRWPEIAELALAYRDRGVVGFDIAGPEEGFPPARYGDVWARLASENFPVTVHAGEGAGLDSLTQAVHLSRADRLGHGVRIIDDITFDKLGQATLGPLANWVRDHQIPLEVAPQSNLQTLAAGVRTLADHPITRLKELDFAVTLNTDNRLMSRTSMSKEMTLLVTEAGWAIDDLADVTIAAAWGAFIHHDERRTLVEDVIVPGFQRLEGVQL